MKVKMFKFVLCLCAAMSFSAAWAKPAVRDPAEFDSEYEAYKAFESDLIRKKPSREEILLQLRDWNNDHPLCVVSRLDLCARLNSMGQGNLSFSMMDDVRKMLNTVPNTEYGKDVKGYYYQMKAEYEFFVSNSEVKTNFNLNNTAKYSKRRAASLCYLLGVNYYNAASSLEGRTYNEKDVSYAYKTARGYFEQAFTYDVDFDVINSRNLRTIIEFANKKNLYMFFSKFANQYLKAKSANYFEDFGVLASSAYEQNIQISPSNLTKAVLVTMLDQEFVQTYDDSGTQEYLDIIKKGFGKKKECVSAIKLIEKFYDKDATLEQSDVDKVGNEVKDFLPVRYMYKMKTSNDIKALREEFESFFRTVGNFYIRLYEKAQSQGDTESMAELKKILEDDYYNKNGKNRLVAKN